MFTYRVSEIYRAVQGEGWHSGMPCTLVRLQGCNLRCDFCDTKYALDPDGGEELTLTEIYKNVQKAHRKGDIVLLTGGEPTMQTNISMLVAQLGHLGPVHLETNGTLPLYSPELFSWITISPKPPNPFFPPTYKRANELKWLVGDDSDVDALKVWLWSARKQINVSVQPISEDPTATRICYDACLAYGWRLSLQLHKLIGVK